MRGRFRRTTSWTTITDAVNVFRPAVPQNMQPELDIRPTTQQWVVRQEPEGMAMDKMRWGLVPFWTRASG